MCSLIDTNDYYYNGEETDRIVETIVKPAQSSPVTRRSASQLHKNARKSSEVDKEQVLKNAQAYMQRRIADAKFQDNCDKAYTQMKNQSLLVINEVRENFLRTYKPPWKIDGTVLEKCKRDTASSALDQLCATLDSDDEDDDFREETIADRILGWK